MDAYCFAIFMTVKTISRYSSQKFYLCCFHLSAPSFWIHTLTQGHLYFVIFDAITLSKSAVAIAVLFIHLAGGVHGHSNCPRQHCV
jgi:hypothetical protein